jgi:hypothetical protein
MVDEQLHKLSVGSDTICWVASEQEGVVRDLNLVNSGAYSPSLRGFGSLSLIFLLGLGLCSLILLILGDFFHFLEVTVLSAAGKQRKEVDIAHLRGVQSDRELYRDALIQQLFRGGF